MESRRKIRLLGCSESGRTSYYTEVKENPSKFPQSADSLAQLLEQENIHLRQELMEYWKYLEGNMKQQASLQVKLQGKSDMVNLLASINEENLANLENLEGSENRLAGFINTLKNNQKKIEIYLHGLTQKYADDFQKLDKNFQVYKQKEKAWEMEISALGREICERNEKIAVAEAMHCKNQQKLRKMKKELEDIVKAEELVEKQHETIHCEHKEKEESWNKEKTQIDEKLEAIKEKFSADMIETRKRTASVCRLRDQELRQFQNNLKMISEHNSQLEVQVKNLEEQLSVQKGIENADAINPKSTRNKSVAKLYSSEEDSIEIFPKRSSEGSTSNESIRELSNRRVLNPSVIGNRFFDFVRGVTADNTSDQGNREA